MTIEEIQANANLLYEKIRSKLDNNEICEEADIEILFSYAFDSRKAIWAFCNQYFELAYQLPSVREKLLEMMVSASARERWIITISVYPDEADEEFCKEIMRRALVDKSKKVRYFAAMRATSFCYKEFISLINDAIELETNIKQKESLRKYHRYLSEDFYIEKLDNQKYRVYHQHGFFPIQSDIKDKEMLRNYVLHHFLGKIYTGYWKKAS